MFDSRVITLIQSPKDFRMWFVLSVLPSLTTIISKSFLSIDCSMQLLIVRLMYLSQLNVEIMTLTFTYHLSGIKKWSATRLSPRRGDLLGCNGRSGGRGTDSADRL